MLTLTPVKWFLQGLQLRYESKSLWKNFEQRLVQDLFGYVNSRDLTQLSESYSNRLMLPEVGINQEEIKIFEDTFKKCPQLMRVVPAYSRKEKYIKIALPTILAVRNGVKNRRDDEFNRWTYAVGYVGNIAAELVDNVVDNQIPPCENIPMEEWRVFYKVVSLLAYVIFEDNIKKIKASTRELNERLEKLFNKSSEIIYSSYRASIDKEDPFMPLDEMKKLYDRTTGQIGRFFVGSAPVDNLELSVLLEKLGGNLGNWLQSYDEIEEITGRKNIYGNWEREPWISHPSLFLSLHGKKTPSKESVERAFHDTCYIAEFYRLLLESDVGNLPNDFETKPFMELMIKLARKRLDKERKRFLKNNASEYIVKSFNERYSKWI